MPNSIEDLAKVQRAIDTLASGEGDLEALNISTLVKQTGSVSADVNVQEIAALQSNVTALTGSAIDLGAVTKIANCYQNLPDLLLEKITRKTVDFLLETTEVTTLAQSVQNVTGMIAEGKRVVEYIEEQKEKSFLELLVEAKEAGVLDRIPIVNTIIEKYGDTVDGLNDILGNIANLDICSMTNYKTGSSASPKPSKIVSTPPNLPGLKPHTLVNTTLVGIKNRYDDAMFRLKDILSDKTTLDNSSQSASMLSSLQHITRAYHDKISRVRDGGGLSTFAEEFLLGAEFEKQKNKELWSEKIFNEFDNRVKSVAITMEAEADVIRSYHTVRGDGNVSGARVGRGVTIYGSPMWDFTTFLDLKAEYRTPEMISYWENERGRNIASAEASYRKRGLKPQVLTLENTTTGAYGGQLVPSRSVSSSKFPGGTILALKNPDGTPYDPAGRNPEGLVKVDDTGNSDLTYKKVDLYIAPEDESAYRNSNMATVDIYLVSTGDKFSKQYKRARGLL